ncbi:MAG: hypothetical protein F4Y53_06610 [Proteobacteria bacterium]|nr:hypothetical protein [Pseudomonadota bacterium]
MMEERPIVNDAATTGKGKQKGFTLIESAIVIGLFTLIIISILVAMDLVMKQRRFNQVVTDITVIRSAVTQWSGGRPLVYPQIRVPAPPPRRFDLIPDPRTLAHWNQISYFLQEPMSMKARREATLDLKVVNPWDGNYTIEVSDNSENNPRFWTLVISQVPASAATVLINHINSTGVAIANIQGTGSRLLGINEDVISVAIGFRE